MNISIIDKLVLVILKAFDKKVVEWVNLRKDELNNLPIISLNIVKKIKNHKK